jgi:hypothetical protein
MVEAAVFSVDQTVSICSNPGARRDGALAALAAIALHNPIPAANAPARMLIFFI